MEVNRTGARRRRQDDDESRDDDRSYEGFIVDLMEEIAQISDFK